MNASVVWFTDRDLGKQFPRILAEAGLAVERHAELFSPTGSDEEWLRHCGENGRVAITHSVLRERLQVGLQVPFAGVQNQGRSGGWIGWSD